MFIDDHIGVSIAGLASDARILWYEKEHDSFKTNDSLLSLVDSCVPNVLIINMLSINQCQLLD